MHPLLLVALSTLVVSGGVAVTGGAVETAGVGPGSLIYGDDPVAQLNETNGTTESSATHPTRTRSTGYMVGSFFIRFGPTLLVVGLLAWILLTRE